MRSSSPVRWTPSSWSGTCEGRGGSGGPAVTSQGDAGTRGIGTMKLGVVVLAHRDPGQVALLAAALEHPRVRLYLHLDAAAPLEPFRRALAQVEGAAPAWLPRHRSRWGGPEVVDASVDGLQAALADGCDYVVQVSGQDLPLWPVERIVAFFRDNRGRSFVEHFPLPDDRWRLGGRLRTERYTFTVGDRRETHLPPELASSLSWKGRILNTLLAFKALPLGLRRFPRYARPHGGSQWWNLTRAAVEFVLAFLEEHPDYRAYHEHTLLPDELFFQSILAGTAFAEEHEVVNDALRFMVWDEGASHPRTLGVEDLPALREAREPFARKFEEAAARMVLSALGDEAGAPGDGGRGGGDGGGDRGDHG